MGVNTNENEPRKDPDKGSLKFSFPANHQEEDGGAALHVSTVLYPRASIIHCPATIMGKFPSLSCGLPFASGGVDCAANAESQLRR